MFLPENNNPNLQNVDSQLLQRQAQGLGAGRELRDLQNSPQLALALRDATAELAPVQGRGWAATAANPFQVFSNIATRRQGQGRLNELQQQADALRGREEQGRLAELEAKQQNILSNRQFQQQQAKDARAFRERMIKEAREHDQQVSDSVSNEATKTFGPKASSLPVFAQKKIVNAREGILQLNRVNDAAGKLSRRDWDKLNNQAAIIAVNAALPEIYEQWAQENVLNLSPEALDYLQQVNAFSSAVRNRLFGSALTANETQLANAFLPSAGGLSMDARQARINNFANKFQDEFVAVDPQGSLKLHDDVPYRAFTSPQEDAKKWVGNIGPSELKVYDRYFNETGQRHKNDPRSAQQAPTGATPQPQSAFPQTRNFGLDPEVLREEMQKIGAL